MGWGDELMVTGQARALQQSDPRRVRIVYRKPRWHAAWEHNPRIARPGDSGDFQDLYPRPGGLRSYIAGKTPERWTWKRHAPERGELYFTPEERAFGGRHAGRIVIEPNIKPGASPNKDWGRARWSELADRLSARGICVAQLGPGSAAILPGVEHIETPTMRLAAAVLARARAAVLPEGGLHHVCAAVATPAVVIFGGYISPAVTGYAGQANLFEPSADHSLGCGFRAPCGHCAAAMAAIAPERVMRSLEHLHL